MAWSTKMLYRSVRGNSMIGQAAAMTYHDLVKFVSPTEDVFSMVTIGVELPVPHSIRADYLDISIAAEELRIPVNR
jgi:hypothetical protein